MTIEIRKAVAGDAPAIIELMRHFAEFERLAEYLEVTEERLHAAMFGPEAFAEGLLAADADGPVGYAVFYPNFLTVRGQRGYFLEDLFVLERGRGKGIGEMLLRRVAQMAEARGFERIDFLVLDWNAPAIGFYEKLGGLRAAGESHFNFTDDAFRRLCDDVA